MSLNFYTEEEDNNKEESIDNYKDLFLPFVDNSPSLSDALYQMFKSKNLEDENVQELIKDIMTKCKKIIDKNFDKITKKYNNISKDDAYIICSYTCESLIDYCSPYKILNQNLVSSNRQNGINNVSKYLNILLKSLRKLPKYYPEKKFLYRCIKQKVNLSKDPFNEKLVPYEIGNKKTFWGFTSTSPNPKTTYGFLKEEEKEKNKAGTVFSLCGDIWGYDIQLFNYFGENEILLEPERKFIVDNVLPPLNEVINITCSMIKTPLVLDIKKENEKIKEEFKEMTDYNKMIIDSVELPNENDYFEWRAIMNAPKDTSYKDGKFVLRIKFPLDYPKHPPDVRFKTPIYHLNVNHFKPKDQYDEPLGKISLSTLNWWKPDYNIQDVVSNIFALFYMANPESSFDQESAKEFRTNRDLYEEKIKYFTKKYANPNYCDINKDYNETWDFTYPY